MVPSCNCFREILFKVNHIYHIAFHFKNKGKILNWRNIFYLNILVQEVENNLLRGLAFIKFKHTRIYISTQCNVTWVALYNGDSTTFRLGRHLIQGKLEISRLGHKKNKQNVYVRLGGKPEGIKLLKGEGENLPKNI